MVKRKKTTVKIIKPNLDKNEGAADTKQTEALVKKVVKEQIVKGGFLISRLDHPTMFMYDGVEVSISPRQKMKVANIDLVKELPKGVAVVKI